MHAAGLIYGRELHHLDHLAPLCAIEGIPLILTDRILCQLAEKFYPDLDVLQFSAHEAPEKLVQNFDTIVYSTPRVLFDQVFYLAQALQNKRIKTIWCPHGNSDKGRHSPLMEALHEEELLLTYGPRIESFIREKRVSAPFHRIGNYRLAYYEKYRNFYDTLLPPKEKKTYLYAPTWQDGEKSSSFPHVWKQLLHPPEDIELLIKLHPHLYEQYPKEIEELKDHHTLIEDFPPIYPLLAKTDVLIGDRSSINYDFLVFGRPLYEIDDPEEDLFQDGKTCSTPVEEVFSPYQPLFAKA